MSATARALAVPELVSLVISELDQPELVVASLVSRMWRKEAQLVMYMTPEVYSELEDWRYYVERLGQLCATLEARPELAARARALALFAYIREGAEEDSDAGDKLKGYELMERIMELCGGVTTVVLEGLTDWVAGDMIGLVHRHLPGIYHLSLSRQVAGADWQWEEPLSFLAVAPLLLPLTRLATLDLVEVQVMPLPPPPLEAPVFHLTSLIHRAPDRAHTLPRAHLAWLLAGSATSLDTLGLDGCESDTLSFISEYPAPIDTVTLKMSPFNLDTDLARLLAIARRPGLTLLGLLDLAICSQDQQDVLAEAVAKLHEEMGREVIFPLVGMNEEFGSREVEEDRSQAGDEL